MHLQLQRKRSSQGSIDSFIGDEAFKGTFAHHRDYNYSNFLKEIGESTQISEIIIARLTDCFIGLDLTEQVNIFII